MSNAVQTAVAAYLSGRNRIINGHALINQRVSGATPVAGTFQYGGADHWAAIIGNATGGAYTQTQAAANDVNGTSKFWIKQTVSTVVPDLSGTKYWGGITQCIEGTQIYDMKGNPNGMVMSFQFLATLAGRYSISIFDNAVGWSYVKSFNYTTGGVPQAFSFPVPMLPNGISAIASSTTYLMVTIGRINAGSWQCPVVNEGAWNNAGYYNGTGVTNWAATVGNYISATDIQLEPGPVASPFEFKTFGEHLRDCQRYYWNTYNYGITPGTAAQDTSAIWVFTGPTSLASNFLNGQLRHPVSMRVQPSGTVWNPHNASTVGSAWAQNAAASLAASVQSVSTEVASVGLQSASTSSGDFIKFHASFTAEF